MNTSNINVFREIIKLIRCLSDNHVLQLQKHLLIITKVFPKTITQENLLKCKFKDVPEERKEEIDLLKSTMRREQRIPRKL